MMTSESGEDRAYKKGHKKGGSGNSMNGFNIIVGILALFAAIGVIVIFCIYPRTAVNGIDGARGPQGLRGLAGRNATDDLINTTFGLMLPQVSIVFDDYADTVLQSNSETALKINNASQPTVTYILPQAFMPFVNPLPYTGISYQGGNTRIRFENATYLNARLQVELDFYTPDAPPTRSTTNNFAPAFLIQVHAEDNDGPISDGSWQYFTHPYVAVYGNGEYNSQAFEMPVFIPYSATRTYIEIYSKGIWAATHNCTANVYYHFYM
jgi:hypothetical protein